MVISYIRMTKHIPHPNMQLGLKQGGIMLLERNNSQSKPLLTKREKEVFELLVQDKTTREIANDLFISEKTVRNHISNAMCMNCERIKNFLAIINFT
jgi:LuxR family transcriptional regulator, transcriptional regulator of spore coat protein